MKNTFSRLVAVAVMSYATTHCYGQNGANHADTEKRIFKGALLLVSAMDGPYRLGSPIPASVTITNISQEDIRVVYTSPEEDDYRVSVFTSDGTPMQNPAVVGADPLKSNGLKSRSERTIQPGQSESRKVDLARLAHIEQVGTYYLIMARRIGTWDSGFVVSDKIKINVAK